MKSTLPLLLAATTLLLPLRAETLTYSDICDRIYDLQHLATPPGPDEKTSLASSFDRASKYDAATDKYINWGANGDGNFGGDANRTMEGDKVVLMDVKGPGVIWRTWTATPDKGHVRIYLDGATEPAVDQPFTSFFDGKSEPFNRAQLCYQTKANGFDCFVPIPFQKSCKILADPDWGNYYHFNYTQYAPGTTVPTFKLPLSKEDSAALDKANDRLAASGEDPHAKREGEKTEKIPSTTPAGEKGDVVQFKGTGAITGLRIKFADGVLPTEIEAQRTFLRQLAIRITFDGAKEPQVWVPFGDFFGNSAGAVKHLELPSGLKDDGTWYSYWYMPFAKGATVALDNDSDKSVSLNWEVVHAPLERAPSSLLRFHAKWHRDAAEIMRPDRAPDWLLLKSSGKGRYVGTQLHVWNPLGGWWGEGDEKWFIDGEKFPSSIGTGSEDYFGYAWSSGGTFVQALHAQDYNDNNQGHVSVNRFHISDNLPFHTQFEGIIEKYFGNDDRGTLYAATVFWYLSTDGKDPYAPVPVVDRVGYWVKPYVYNEPGAIEGESMQALNNPTIPAGGQDMRSWDKKAWSNNQQLFWQSKATGDKIDLGFNIDTAGKYEIKVHLTKAGDYGIHQLSINGQKAGDPIDSFADHVSVGDPVSLGIFDLAKGQNTLTVETTGRNPSASGYLFGLDYLKPVPAP